MRWLLLALLMLPMAAAHGDNAHGGADVIGFIDEDLDHIRLAEFTLAPGEVGNYTLSFSGAPFKAGWHWLLRGNVDEGILRVEPIMGERLLARYHWGVGPHLETALLPVDDKIQLRLTNVGDGNATMQFYYDQTCECQYKRVPLPNGPVWFNIDAEAGQRVSWQFTLQPAQLGVKTNASIPSEVEVRATHMVVDPDDILLAYLTKESTREVLSIDDPMCRAAARWNGCVTLEFVAEESGRQLVWFDITHRGDPSWTYMILPEVEVEETAQTTPMPVVALLAALLGAVYVRRRAT